MINVCLYLYIVGLYIIQYLYFFKSKIKEISNFLKKSKAYKGILSLPKYLRCNFLRNRELIKAVYYFCKKLRLRCLTGFWTRHYISSVSKRKLTRTFCCSGWYNMETVSFCHIQRQLESITSAFIFVFPFHCVIFSSNACICIRSNQKVFIHTSYCASRLIVWSTG